MNRLKSKQKSYLKVGNDPRQNGSALVIALFILVLLSVFVALALSRTSSQAAAIGNETAEARTVYAAQGSLEMMTRNFNKVFEIKLNPSDADINAVRSGAVPLLSTPAGPYTFFQEVDPTSESVAVTLAGGPFAGLYAIRDNWRLRTTATDASQVQVQLTRNILNNRIPIFQFGIFYDDDLELFRPPRFGFGGRVHSNRHFFISPGPAGVYFDSRVTAAGEIITQSWRNGYIPASNLNLTKIKNASLQDIQLYPDKGSVLNTTSGDPANIFASSPDLPPSKLNPNWAADSAIFDGNLRSRVDPLRLPLSLAANSDLPNSNLIEMIKRGKKTADVNGGDLFSNNAGTLAPVVSAVADNDILRAERYTNKTGIRVSLADSKAKLPGCASGTGTEAVAADCGIRLDGNIEGRILPLTGSSEPPPLPSPIPSPLPATISESIRGYQPKSMKMQSFDTSFDYKSTRVNGERLYTGGSREVWIKVETVQINVTTGTVVTRDITQDFLSLGITEQAPAIAAIDNYDETPPDNRTDTNTRSLNLTAAQSPPTGTDSRSIIKIQRFAIPGVDIQGEPKAGVAAPATRWIYPYSSYNFVVRYFASTPNLIDAGCRTGCTSINDDPNNTNREDLAHLKKANGTAAIVPFPIEMFDTREGTYFDSAASYTAGRVTRNGVMSMIDIDVANLRRFLRGDFNGLFPTTTPFAVSNANVGLMNTNIPEKNGWVLYISDRRGDADFDGEYDMEDVYGATPGNDGIRQEGEDLNRNNALDAKYIAPDSNSCLDSAANCEAAKYADNWYPDFAAVTDHKYYRRGIRLINGTTIPGIFDEVTAANTRGFTVASENGVYVWGNYNATNVNSVPATGNTVFEEYRPFGRSAAPPLLAIAAPTHIPASIVADAVTILSTNWKDAQSFRYPFDLTGRLATETTIRFAMISGDTIATKLAVPNQGSTTGAENLNGGVHNFKRFLERWTNPSDSNFAIRLNYSGSLINLFNSRNNNGSFKCCTTVYNPPIRNWVFDGTFLTPSRLPPGTPFFQFVQTTGFQRTND